MLDISVNTRLMVTALDNLSERQLPFATMKSLNEVATIFQNAERKVMQQDFTIRRPWVLQGVKIDRGDFATKQKLSVRIHIDDPQSFLNKFEPGGTRTPFTGRSLSVPIMVRSGKNQLIPQSLRPKALHFQDRGRGVLEGDKRTFMIQRPDGTGVILQRKGRAIAVKRRKHGPLMPGQRHDNALVVLYVLRPKTPVPASLHFYATALVSFKQNWNDVFTKWWNTAIATANPG